MRILSGLPVDNLQDVGPAAHRLEGRGFDGVSTQENRHNPFLPLAVAATQTSRLELRTSVAIAFARSPMASAGIAWDLQAASNGRFVLGLGSQVKGHNLRRFSVPWSAPAPRMKEYVQALRAIWRCWQAGERLNFQGRHYQFTLMTPNFTPAPLTCPMPAVHIAAVGPAMLRVAGEECDGVMLHGFCTRRYLEQRVEPRLAEALRRANRSRKSFQVAGGGFVATGATDEAVQKMFEWVRSRIGFYGSTPAYWPVFEVHDLLDLGQKLNELSKRGQWNEMTRLISDDVVRLFAAVGRHDQLAAAIEKHYGGLTDAISCPEDLPPDLIQDLRRIPTPFQS